MRRGEPAPVPVAAPIRWWRLRPWSRNHLMRPSDRYEATLMLLTSVLVLLLIPVAAAFGTATHTRLEHQTHTLRAAVHQVPAVLLEDTYVAPDSPDYAIRPVGTPNTALAVTAACGSGHSPSAPSCYVQPSHRVFHRNPLRRWAQERKQFDRPPRRPRATSRTSSLIGRTDHITRRSRPVTPTDSRLYRRDGRAPLRTRHMG
ncbi:hypothetical protein [Rhodococcus koreensis]